MALIDLTNVDPYGPQVEAQARAQQATANMWTNISAQINKGIQAGVARREALAQRNMQIRDKEYAYANQATDKLVQTKSNHKYTDQQLQQVGQGFKQEFYDAVKEYEASDKGDEARQKFEQVKQTSLGSARTLGDSIEKLDASMDAFMTQARNGGISDAVNPAVRSFMADLNNPEIPADQYQIIKDPETGDLKYQGKTSDGHDVDFFLKDIANGENGFNPQAKVDMPDVVQNLMKGVSTLKKTEQTDWGMVELTDWNRMGVALDGRIEELFKNDDNFKQLAAGLGYGYEELENVKNGVPFVDEQEEGAQEITSMEDLKKAMKRELLQQVEILIPHESNEFQLQAAQVEAEKAEAIKQQVGQVAVQTNQALSQTQDFNNYLGRDITIKGSAGKIASIIRKGDKIVVTNRKGDKGSKETYDVNNVQSMALLQSQLTGGDYNLILNSILDSQLSEISYK